jgi:hypothetical protein
MPAVRLPNPRRSLLRSGLWFTRVGGSPKVTESVSHDSAGVGASPGLRSLFRKTGSVTSLSLSAKPIPVAHWGTAGHPPAPRAV